MSALTRRCGGDFYMFVDCQPARRQCLPDMVPAQAFVRAGDERVWRLWFWRGGLPSAHGLRLRLYCRALPLVHGWQLRFCCGVLPSVHACLFSFVRKKETACGSLRSYSAGSRSPFVRSRGVGAVICPRWFTSGLRVSLWRSRRGCRGRKERGDGTTGTGGGVFVRLCAATLAL